MVRPNMHWLELDITYVCGMNCINCNRMTGIAPGRPEDNVTVAQIERLIEDSVRLQYPWREWFLVGSEPTIHPELDAIIGRIAEYRDDQNRELKLTLATHGHGERTQERLAELSAAFPFLQFLNSHKTGPIQPDFVAPCVAPEDIDAHWSANHRYEGCSVSGHLSLNYMGFYLCAVAGAIDRVFGLHQAIESLADVSEAAMIEKYQTFCRLCGYYRPIKEPSCNLLYATWRVAPNLTRWKSPPFHGAQYFDHTAIRCHVRLSCIENHCFLSLVIAEMSLMSTGSSCVSWDTLCYLTILMVARS